MIWRKRSCLCSGHEIQELSVWSQYSSQVILFIGCNGQCCPTEINERLVMDFSEIWTLLWIITHFTEFTFYGKVWLRYFSKILHTFSKTLYIASDIFFLLPYPDFDPTQGKGTQIILLYSNNNFKYSLKYVVKWLQRFSE